MECWIAEKLQKKAQIICRWNFWDCRKIAEYLQKKCRFFCRWNLGLQKNCRKSADFAAQNALFLHCTLCFCRKSHFTLCFAKKMQIWPPGPPAQDRALQSTLFLHFLCTSEKVQIWPPARPLQSALFLQSKIPSAKYLHFFCNPPPNPIHTFSAFSAKIIQPLSQAGCHKLTFFLPERTQTRARRSTSNALPTEVHACKEHPGRLVFPD